MEEIKNIFPGAIEDVRRKEAAVPKRVDIDLAIPLNDFVYGISGNLFYVWDAPVNTYIDIKINKTSEKPIRFVEQTGLRTPFDKLLITTPAGQMGTLTIIYGTESPALLELIDNRVAIAGSLDDILAELQGDAAPETWGAEITVGNAAAVSIIAANVDRKACRVQAKSTNTGIVYLGFDNTVTTTKWIAELQAGMSFDIDDYRGDLYARADALAQLVGWGEW